MSEKVKPKKPKGTRHKKPKYRNRSTIRRLPETNITPAVNFQLFTPNFQSPGLKSERVPTPEEEEEEENIQLRVEEKFPLNNNRGPPREADYDEEDWTSNNRGPPREADYDEEDWTSNNRGPPREADYDEEDWTSNNRGPPREADYDEDDWPSNNRGPQASVKHKWYVDDNRIPPIAASCYDFNIRPHPEAAAASCYDDRELPRAAAARFDSDEYEKSIREELENIGAIPLMDDDMIEKRIFRSSDIPVYPLTSTRVEMPSLMQISLDIKDIGAKIKETRTICELNEGTHLPVCVASAFSALGLMLPQQLIDEIKYQRESEAGIPDKLLLDYLYRKNIITSKTMLDFKDEAELITKIQTLLKKGNSTIITVYGGNNRMSHMVLIVNAGPHIDRSGRDRSGVYCVDILANVIIELDGETNTFQAYLSRYGRYTNSILVYNGLTINEKRGVKRKEKEEFKIRKKKLAPSKKRRLNGGRKTRKHVHL